MILALQRPVSRVIVDMKIHETPSTNGEMGTYSHARKAAESHPWPHSSDTQNEDPKSRSRRPQCRYGIEGRHSASFRLGASPIPPMPLLVA